MSNYKETTITGSSYTRCNQIVINNNRNVTPTVRFDEQVVVSMGTGDTVITGVGSIEMAFDPTKIIPLLDPTTGEATGQSMSYGTVYAILYSAYLDAALTRDAAQIAPTGV